MFAKRVNVVSPEAVRTPMWEKQEFWSGLVAQHGRQNWRGNTKNHLTEIEMLIRTQPSA